MVAIIGILAAIAIPQYQNYVARAQVAEGLSLASGIKTAIVEYHNTHGAFPPKLGGGVGADHEALGIAAKTELTGNYVKEIEVWDKGNVLVKFLGEVDGVNTLIANKTFWLIPTDNGGSISWHCACATRSDYYLKCSTGIPTPHQTFIDQKYLPSSCLE